MSLLSSSKNFTGFLKSFTNHWFTAMSGPLSVPAAILAIVLDAIWAKIILGLTALICGVSASYGIWIRERKKVIELEKELHGLKEPGFDMEFNYEQNSFYHTGTNRTNLGEVFTFELYRIAVKNHHASQEIKVHIMAIEGSHEFDGALPLPLQFQHDETASLRSIKLVADERVFIDVVMQSATTTKGFKRTIRHTVAGITKQIESDKFKLKIAIIGEKASLEKWFYVSAELDSKLRRLLKMELLSES